jgi:sensor histidine kinase regulating citrate/malate metabolism
MTLCKTRDVLLLEPKEVGGLARWRSSFIHGHKEMILASSQRATLLMHEHCTNVGGMSVLLSFL